eukprot:Plantae.Rhodophyta-Hildenbrandia_rubra.ctg2528.p1 GENE.Plantae.Rhodophyta-Hildenbrandia_rubra.ctg2528~~Plantae.Rhodophyta-Hildenbrandia_rubra.ctg2528.p1  ORF type:complete len:749 (+),score=129.56 Plantae.Rhodophyta-Hildenbrandia_rubra.ctg2528:759-3005(+)
MESSEPSVLHSEDVDSWKARSENKIQLESPSPSKSDETCEGHELVQGPALAVTTSIPSGDSDIEEYHTPSGRVNNRPFSSPTSSSGEDESVSNGDSSKSSEEKHRPNIDNPARVAQKHVGLAKPITYWQSPKRDTQAGSQAVPWPTPPPRGPSGGIPRTLDTEDLPINTSLGCYLSSPLPWPAPPSALSFREQELWTPNYAIDTFGRGNYDGTLQNVRSYTFGNVFDDSSAVDSANSRHSTELQPVDTVRAYVDERDIQDDEVCKYLENSDIVQLDGNTVPDITDDTESFKQREPDTGGNQTITEILPTLNDKGTQRYGWGDFVDSSDNEETVSRGGDHESESEASNDEDYEEWTAVNSKGTLVQWLSLRVPSDVSDIHVKTRERSFKMTMGHKEKRTTSSSTVSEEAPIQNNRGVDIMFRKGSSHGSDNDSVFAITPMSDIDEGLEESFEKNVMKKNGLGAMQRKGVVRRPLASRWMQSAFPGPMLRKSLSEGAESPRVQLVGLQTREDEDRGGFGFGRNGKVQVSFTRTSSLDVPPKSNLRRLRGEQGRIPSAPIKNDLLSLEDDAYISPLAKTKKQANPVVQFKSRKVDRRPSLRLSKRLPSFQAKRVVENVGDGLQNLAAIRRGRGDKVPEAARTVFATCLNPREALEYIAKTCRTHLGLTVLRKRGELKLKVHREEGGRPLERHLRADIAISQFESGMTKVSFKRSVYDWGKTDFAAFYEVYEAVRQYLTDLGEEAVVSIKHR